MEVSAISTEVVESDNNQNNAVSPWARRLIFLALLAMNFFGFGSYSVIAPFFPTEAQKKGVSQTVVGLIFSCFALLMLVFSPTWGHFISRSGPKWFLVIGGIVCGAANIVFGLLNAINDTILFTIACFMVRIVEALGFAAFDIASFATAGRLYPETLGSAMGFIEISIGAGMGVGPAIGSALYSVGGYPLPFVVLGGLVIFMAITVYLLIACVPRVGEQLFHSIKVEKGLTLWQFVRIRTAQLTMLIVIGCACGLTLQIPILALHIQEQLGIDGTGSGYFFSTQLISYAVMALVAGRLSDFLPRYRIQIMIFGLVLVGVGLVLAGPSPFFELVGVTINESVASSITSLAILGIGGALVIVPSFQVLIDSAQETGYTDGTSTHGIVGGSLNASFTLGAMIGPAIGAAMTEKLGFAITTSAVGAGQFVLAIAMGIFLAIHSACRSHTRYTPLDEKEAALTEKTPLLTSSLSASYST